MEFAATKQYTLAELKKEITEVIGTKAKPLNNCMIRWNNDACEMIDYSKQYMTQAQYSSMMAWARV